MGLSIKLFLSILPFAMLFDYLWINHICAAFYKREIGEALRIGADGRFDAVVGAALMVYFFLPLGIVAFVLPRVSVESRDLSALAWGGLFGLVTYGIYDMTNLAVVKGWNLKASLVDILWGTLFCAVLGWIGSRAETTFGGGSLS